MRIIMKRIHSMLISVICAMTFSACSDVEEEVQAFDENGISLAALQTFKDKYGADSNSVRWEQKKDFYMAAFYIPFITKGSQIFETSAWFDVNGVEYQVCQRLNFIDLSSELRMIIGDYLTTKYSDWVIFDLEQVFRKDMGFIYAFKIMNVKDNDMKKEISYSPEGILLKDKWDSDEKIYPVVISDEIKNILGKLFPASSKVVILEVANAESRNEIEIDILANNQHLEVVLDLLSNYLYTKQPISLDEAKQQIEPALIKKLFDFASVAGMDLTNPVILKQTEFAIYDDVDKGRYFKVSIAVDNRKLDLVIDKEGNIHNV